MLRTPATMPRTREPAPINWKPAMKPMLRSPSFPRLRLSVWAMPVLALLLASCSATGRVTKTDPCAGWSKITTSRDDVLTDGTAKQILAHDEHGASIGCWKSHGG